MAIYMTHDTAQYTAAAVAVAVSIYEGGDVVVSGECHSSMQHHQPFVLSVSGRGKGRRSYSKNFVGNRYLSAFIYREFEFDHSLHLGTSSQTVLAWWWVPGGQQCPSH